MAHVGHTVASLNIFLDIPVILRGLSQSLESAIGPEMRVGSKFLNQIHQVDPLDPTSVVDEYLDDWWNHGKEWKTHSLEVDQVAAFQFHQRKVKEKIILGPDVNIFPIGSTVLKGAINLRVPQKRLQYFLQTQLSAPANLIHAKNDYVPFWVKSIRHINPYDT